MRSLESANIRPLNPKEPRSADTVHPGSSNFSEPAEGTLPDDQNFDIPLDVLTSPPPEDPLRKSDTEYPFTSPTPHEGSTPLQHQAVQRLLKPQGQMSPPLGLPPISADDEVLTPSPEEFEPTQWVSQAQLDKVNGFLPEADHDDMGDYMSPMETGISDSPEAVDRDYFGSPSSEGPEVAIDPKVDIDTTPSVEELINGLAISEEKEGEAREMDTSYPTPEEFSSDDEPDMPTESVLPLTPPLSPEPQPGNLYSDDDEDSPNTSPDSPNLSLPSQGSTYEIKVHVSDRGTTSILETKRTSNGDIGVSE